MDTTTSKYLALAKTVIVLVEDNCTDTQLSNLKTLIHILTDIQNGMSFNSFPVGVFALVPSTRRVRLFVLESSHITNLIFLCARTLCLSFRVFCALLVFFVVDWNYRPQSSIVTERTNQLDESA
jgi:hypothetical protein